MHHFIFASLLLSACATTGFSTDHDFGVQHASLELDTAASVPDDGERFVHLVPLDPTLQSVDRIQHQLTVELGDTASARVRLCVAPAGQVLRISIERSSSSKAFDEAVLHDVASWRFLPTPGPATVERCEATTVRYRSQS